jgi:hypothetical protein
MIRAPFLPRPLALAACAGLALTLSHPATADEPTDKPAEEMSKGEKRLAKLLEGRVAGEPQDCIRSLPNQRLRVIDKTAYVYGSGRTIYVQRTQNPEFIDDDDFLVSRRFNGSQICKFDITTTADRFAGFFTGAVFFEDFVPYTRAEKSGG